jgi:hypothetical protein
MTRVFALALSALMSLGFISTTLAQDAYGGIHGNSRGSTSESAR